MESPRGRTVDFDDILHKIGSFGKYQILLFAFCAVRDIFSSWLMMFFMFSNAHPGFRCASTADVNVTAEGPFYHDVTNEMTSLANFTDSDDDINKCTSHGIPCTEFVFNDDFTSIITEVRTIDSVQ